MANIFFYVVEDLSETIKLPWNDYLNEREQTIGRLLNNFAESRVADERFLDSIILDSLSLPIKFLQKQTLNPIIETITYRSIDKLIDIRNYLDQVTVATKVDNKLDLHLKESKLLKLGRGIDRLNFFITAIRNKQFEVFLISNITFEDRLPYYDKISYASTQSMETENKVISNNSSKLRENKVKIDLEQVFSELEKLELDKKSEKYSQRQVALFYTYLKNGYNLPDLNVKPIGSKLAKIFGFSSKSSGQGIYDKYRLLRFTESRTNNLSNKKFKDLEKIVSLFDNFPDAQTIFDKEFRLAKKEIIPFS